MITAPAATGASKCPDYMHAAKAGSRVVLSTVDTLWHAEASLHWIKIAPTLTLTLSCYPNPNPNQASLHWWLPSGLSAAHAAPCMWLAMRVVAATPPRERNKVKLLALLVSSAGSGSVAGK